MGSLSGVTMPNIEEKLNTEIAKIKMRIEEQKEFVKRNMGNAAAISVATTELRGLHTRLAELENRKAGPKK